MPRRSAFAQNIHDILSRAVDEIVKVVSAESGVNDRQRSTRDARNGKASRRGARRGVDDATLASVLKVIKAKPGLRSEQIYVKLELPIAEAKKALEKLRRTGRVKTRGEKRATTYSVK